MDNTLLKGFLDVSHLLEISQDGNKYAVHIASGTPYRCPGYHHNYSTQQPVPGMTAGVELPVVGQRPPSPVGVSPPDR